MAHELYNQLSKYIDASYRATKNYQQEVDFILRRVGNVLSRKIVIDVACGSGGHAELLSKAGFDVYAVDLIGFKSKLYYDFSDTKRSGTVCVFVGRK